MKKAIAILLAACMLFAFAACSDKEKATPADAQTTQTQADETTVPETTEAVKPEPAKPEPVTILDNEYLTLTINDAYVDEDMGYTLKATFENKGEKDYSYYIDPSSINGIAVMNYFYTDVSAGKKAVEKIEFEDELLRLNGVGEYTDIEMTVLISNEDDLFEEPIAEYTVHYYPQGEEKATKYERQPLDTDKVLLDNEYITVTAIGFTHDDEYDCTDLNLYILNKYEDNIGLDAKSCTVNDVMMDVFLGETIPAGKAAFCYISFDDEELKDKDIAEMENIEIELAGYSEETMLGVLGNINLDEISQEDIEDLIGGGLDWLTDMCLFEETVVYEP